VRHGTAFAVQGTAAPQAAAPCGARRTKGWDSAALLQSAIATDQLPVWHECPWVSSRRDRTFRLLCLWPAVPGFRCRSAGSDAIRGQSIPPGNTYPVGLPARRVPLSPAPTSPALLYLRDTRLFGPCTKTKPGSVPMTTSSSPSGVMKRPKEGPA